MRLAGFLIPLMGLGLVAQSVTVPLIVEGNAPIVEIEVRNGSKARTARFLVDTGGGALMLGSKLMADLAIPPAGPVSEEEGDRLVPLEGVTCEIGGFELNLKGVRIFGNVGSVRTMQRNAVEGMIPASVLRKYRVIFDYPAGTFTLGQAEGTPRGIRLETPIAAKSGFPRIELEIAGTKYGFLLDTGASFTMVSRAVLDRWKEQNPQWSSAHGFAGFANMFGGAMENEGLMLRVPEMKAGDFSLRDSAMVSRSAGTFEKWMSGMMSGPIVGSIAGNILRDFRVEIDYQHGFTYLDRKRESADLDLVSIGLVLRIADHGDPVVTGISSGADAGVKSSIHPNDILIAIEGKALNGEPLAVIAERLSGKDGSKKTLTIGRNGQRLDLTLPVKRLL